MRRYRVEIEKGARRQLEGLSEKDFRRIDRQILSLEENPRPPGCKKLQIDQKVYRLRQGNYRSIYHVNDGLSVVRVLRVMHRRDVYR